MTAALLFGGMMGNWETHYLPDVEHFVRIRPDEEYDFIVHVEAFEGVSWPVDDEWPEDVPIAVHKRYGCCNDRVGVHELDDGYRTLRGTIDWEGKAHLTWGEEGGEASYCGMTHAIRIGKLLEHTYRIAWEFHLKHREDAYEGDWDLFSGDYVEEGDERYDAAVQARDWQTCEQLLEEKETE